MDWYIGAFVHIQYPPSHLHVYIAYIQGNRFTGFECTVFVWPASNGIFPILRGHLSTVVHVFVYEELM